MAGLTNPLKTDLDAGGHNVTNAVNFQTADGAVLGGTSSMVVEAVVVDALPTFGTAVTYKAGIIDPSVTGLDVNPGSVYSRRVGGNPAQPWTGTGELWFKTGPLPTDWTRIA